MRAAAVLLPASARRFRKRRRRPTASPLALALQAELVALGVGEDDPADTRWLALGDDGTKAEQTGQLVPLFSPSGGIRSRWTRFLADLGSGTVVSTASAGRLPVARRSTQRAPACCLPGWRPSR